MRRGSAASPRRRDPLAHHRVPSPPPELEVLVLAAAAEAAPAGMQPDWTARLWASTTARMLWAATICALLLGHTLASRPLPGVAVVADDSASSRALATLLEMPSQSFATIATAMRRLPAREARGITTASRAQIEMVIEETGG